MPFDWNLDPKGQSSWLPGGGKQLIVDSKAPGGVLRNKVKIQFYPPNLETSGSTVYLKIFDVDDPVPIDFDTRGSPNPIIDTNGEAGGDNFGSEALRTGRFKFPEQQGVSNRQIQFDSSGNQTSASCEISASLGTMIDVLFETTAQPGDNFRAVLSLSAGELATVQTENPLADGYLNSGYEGIRKLVPYTNLFSSEMLTIWRQLSVEIDSMPTPPALLSAPDNIPFQAGFAVWQGSGNPDKVRCPMNLLSYESDFYVNGVLELQNGDKFKIIGSESNHWNTTTMLKLDRALTPLEGSLISSSAGTLKDDDGIRWPVNDLGPMLPRFDLISDPSTQNLIVARFIPAYILVKPIVWLNTNPTVQWEQYHGPESDNNKFVASRDINGSQNFWCAHLSAGYQTTSPGKSIFEDAEDSLLGATWAANKACVVFPENIREYGFIESYLHSPDPWIFAKGVKELRIGLAGVAAHELGHLPGQHSGNTNPEADHNEGGLQGDGVFNIRIETFRAKSIRRFRRVDDWTGGPPS